MTLFVFQLLESEVYQQEIREFRCAYPTNAFNPRLSEDQCRGSCVQLFQRHPVLATDHRHQAHQNWQNLRVEHIQILSGCRFEPA